MRSPGTRIERYVVRRTLTSVASALAVIVFLIVLVDFVELSRDVGQRVKSVSALDMLSLALMHSPSVVLILIPFAFLFGVLSAFMNMNRRGELIAMRAAGVSAWRFILPAAAAAALIGVLVVTALNPGASKLNARFERRQSALLSGYLVEQPKPVWLRQGDGQTQVIIRARSNQGPGVLLKDVWLEVYRTDDQGALQFVRRIDAETAQLFPGELRLTKAREAAAGQPATTYESLSIPSTLDADTALAAFAPPQAVPFWSLPGLIARTEEAGFSAVTYRLQFQQLLATPLMYAAMSILAAAFSLRLLRLGGLAALAGAGVGLGFAVFFINQLAGALGRSGMAPAVLAAWAPPLLALLAGCTLLFYTEDG
jgi:lipopolysaccharide export system permease protein